MTTDLLSVLILFDAVFVNCEYIMTRATFAETNTPLRAKLKFRIRSWNNFVHSTAKREISLTIGEAISFSRHSSIPPKHERSFEKVNFLYFRRRSENKLVLSLVHDIFLHSPKSNLPQSR